MQRISYEQAERIMDVVDQCRVVSQTYQERAQALADPSGDQLAESRYARSLEALTSFYVRAGSMAIRDEVLVPIIVRNLPEPLSQQLFLPLPPMSA